MHLQEVALCSQRIVLQANCSRQNPKSNAKIKDDKQAKWSELLVAFPLSTLCGNKNPLLYSFVRSFIEMKDASEHTMGAFSSELMTVMSLCATNSAATTISKNKMPKQDYLLRNTGRAICFCAAPFCVANTWTPLKTLRLSTLLQAKCLWALSWTWQEIKETTRCLCITSICWRIGNYLRRSTWLWNVAELVCEGL